MIKNDYKSRIGEYLASLSRGLELIDRNSVDELMNLLEDARLGGKKVFVMGNGGSAATASHFVCDFNKGVSCTKDRKYRFICLNDNVPVMMAYANDLSYDDVFVGQLQNFLEEGDLVLGISGSGNSENVVRALEWANLHGGISVGLTGYSGGRVKQISRYNVHIPLDDMQVVEDLHLVLNHCMMKILSSD